MLPAERHAPQVLHLGGQTGVVGDAHPALTRRNDLVREQREARDVPDRADAVRLGGVLDHPEVVLVGDLHDRVHVAAPAVDVHRHDGPGPRSDLVLDQGDVDVQVVAAVHEHGCGTRVRHRPGRCDHGELRNQHLVARPDAQRAQRQGQCRGARRTGDGVLDSVVSGERLLESRNVGSLRGDPPAGDRVGDVLQFAPLMLGLETEYLNPMGSSFVEWCRRRRGLLGGDASQRSGSQGGQVQHQIGGGSRTAGGAQQLAEVLARSLNDGSSSTRRSAPRMSSPVPRCGSTVRLTPKSSPRTAWSWQSTHRGRMTMGLPK